MKEYNTQIKQLIKREKVRISVAKSSLNIANYQYLLVQLVRRVESSTE